MGPYAGVDYNLTLCPLQSRLQHIYHWATLCQSLLSPVPESTSIPQQGTLDLASGQKINKGLCHEIELISLT